MDSPFIIPLGAFALTALIVGITQFACIHNKETEVAQRMHEEEMDHKRKMQELDLELARVKLGQ